MGRMEIITRTERRRRHSDADRERILAEADRPGVTVRSVAQKYDLAESLIYGWRAARRLAAAADGEPLAFVSCGTVVAAAGDDLVPTMQAVMPNPGSNPVAQPVPSDEFIRPHPGYQPGAIDVSFPSGIQLRVDTYVNEKALTRVLRCLKAAA